MNHEADVDVTRRHALALRQLPAGAAVTMLHIGDKECIVVSGRTDEPPLTVRVQVGTATSGHVAFRHDPPTPVELENAIEVVENEVMPLSKRLPRPSVLIGVGRAIRAIARAAAKAGDGKVRLPLDEVELLFQQLAAVSQGRAVSSSGLPPGIAFAASLLILREFMHHLGFDSIDIEA